MNCNGHLDDWLVSFPYIIRAANNDIRMYNVNLYRSNGTWYSIKKTIRIDDGVVPALWLPVGTNYMHN